MDVKKEDYEPGSFGCHEALHATSMILSMTDNELAEHPAIKMQPSWLEKVLRIQLELIELYQAIGEAHMRKLEDDELRVRTAHHSGTDQ